MSGSQVTGPAGPIDRTLFERAATQLNLALSNSRTPPLPAEGNLPYLNGSELSPGGKPVAIEEVNERLDGWLGEIVAGTGADMGNIQVFDPTTSTLRIRAQLGFAAPFLDHFRKVYADHAACGAAFSARATVIVADVATSPLFSPEARQVMLEAEALAVQSSHLSTPHRQRVGVVSVHYRHLGVPEEGRRQLRRFAPPLAEVVALCLPALPRS